MWPLLVVSLVVSALWIPVLLFFFKNWRERKNPISLAISGVIFFVVYSDVLVLLCKYSGSDVPFYIMQITEALTIAFFYVSFRWAKWKFGGELGAHKRSKG